ncbi:alpha-beta hydrolase superfamily lysophospholipase [Rhizobium sp. BK529]|uniref:alpha/beta fold hydrolase n=1 Tax=unclassified Rhizobium TaxID=2613769 RepID=UPI001047ECE0|nr:MULTISPECIES: alpha/beta hydrolase [unclassified Rhizobium]MBB3590215.1 alpha-beta hydrolase superfamily lysophospholipase [Rhizobium sp. BK529]TCS04910.1 alpha-beta hydrolase superfamily lysophospholipase [Rhizobium sp. BK418]
MFSETLRLENAGASLACHHQPAEGLARAILMISHGLAEHSRRYWRFAEAMAARGCHVYAHDHRGHGETTAADAPLGRFARRDGIEHVVSDIAAVHDFVTSRHPGLPVILLGHSMGGLIALNAAADLPGRFAALAVWNSNFAVGLSGRLAQAILLGERMLKGSDVPSDMLPRLTFSAWGKSISDHRTEFDWLSCNPAEVDAYIADPLCGFDASVSLWLDVFALTFRGIEKEQLEKLPKELPIHLVGGGKDPATSKGKAILWLSKHLKSRGFSRISTEIYQDMRHETLNEIGAQSAISDFAGWCDEALRTVPSERT